MRLREKKRIQNLCIYDPCTGTSQTCSLRKAGKPTESKNIRKPEENWKIIKRFADAISSLLKWFQQNVQLP